MIKSLTLRAIGTLVVSGSIVTAVAGTALAAGRASGRA
jgi:hypothetical protein